MALKSSKEFLALDKYWMRVYSNNLNKYERAKLLIKLYVYVKLHPKCGYRAYWERA